MKKQVNGKGDRSRVTDKQKFDDNWDRIFNSKKGDKEVHDSPLGAGFAHKDVKHFADGFLEGDWQSDE